MARIVEAWKLIRADEYVLITMKHNRRRNQTVTQRRIILSKKKRIIEEMLNQLRESIQGIKNA